jgi:hypothetical protein
MARGVYRTTNPRGAEYAAVDFGTSARLESVSRRDYEANGYEPPFDELPTKEESESSEVTD